MLPFRIGDSGDRHTSWNIAGDRCDRTALQLLYPPALTPLHIAASSRMHSFISAHVSLILNGTQETPAGE